MKHDSEEDIQTEDVEFVDSEELGAEKNAQDKLKKMKEKVALLQKEKAEYLDGWQRARADYANLLKSADEDKKRLRAIIEENFIVELLPMIDSFAMAMGNTQAWEKVDAAWRTGVEYIHQQLMGVLKERRFEAFGKVGEPFDPKLHQAVSDTDTADASLDQRIATVLQQGYKLGEIILRPARVTVYVKKDASAN